MADNILTKDRADGDLDIAAKDLAGVKYPRNILTDPSGADLTPLTDAALRATPVPVSVPGSLPVTGTFWQATQPVSLASWAGLTDAQLRAAAVPVTGTVAVSGSVPVTGTFWQATQPVSLASWAGLTDAQLRATPVPTDSQRTDALLVMLSRVVKLLESNAVVDAAQRQRISVDSFPATIPALTTVTTVTTLSNATAIAGMDREQWINAAKQTYAQSIRARLTFQ